MQRTPEQIAAIETVGVDLCVDAGAGSGKTSVLVDRILHIIERKLANLDQIVAITFTENAAAEMKERLRRECRKRAPEDDPAMMSFWRDVERRVEGARISTIHGFCSRLLRENALHLGLDPDFVVLAEAESTLMRMQAVSEALHELLTDEDPAALHVASEYGLARLRATLRNFLNRPALLDAVGQKFPMDDPQALRLEWTRVLEQFRREQLLELPRLPYLRRLRRRLDAFEGRCLKATDKREVVRVELMLHIDRILAGADVPTIEASLEGMANWSATGSSKKNWDSPEIAEELGKLQTEIRDFAREFAPKEPDPAVEEAAAELACEFYSVFLHVAQRHNELKGDGNALDFEDLIYRALNMLRDNAMIRARTARSTRYLLIDEFQDTDAVQFDIANLLTNEPGGPELFIVGDAKQSIYYFRGAEVEVFQRARKATDQVIPLARNFRTLPEVLQFVNDVFAASGLLHAVEPDYRGMEAHRDPCGGCRIEFLLPEPPEGKLSKSEHREREAALLAARLAEMCRTAPVPVSTKDGTGIRNADFGDVAILFRSFSDVYVYERQLREWGIPYTLVAGRGFYDRQEIIDVRNLLTLLLDPWNEMALFAFLRSPMVGLSDEALVRLHGWGDERRGLAHAFNSGFVPERRDDADMLRAARELLDDLRLHRELPLPELLRRALDLTGYEAILLGQFLGTQKASNVRKLLDLAHDFSRTRLPRLGAFLRYLEEVSTGEVREGEAALAAEGSGAVTLTTVHKAKGLEWPIVVVPDLTRSPRHGLSDPVAVERDLGLAARVCGDKGELVKPALYEAIAARHDQREEAEEARVLYVALTRARDWLLLGAAPEDKKISGSWFETLLAQYKLLDRRDSEEFSGEGWKAVVRRKLAGKRIEKEDEGDTTVPLREAVAARIAPAAPGPLRRRLFSVSELLNRLPATEDHPAPQSSADAEAARPLVDPATRGTMLHTVLQRWDFRAPVRPLAELTCRKLCPIISARKEVAEDLIAVAERLRQSTLGEVLAKQKALEREVPFVLQVGEDALVAGDVDAVLDDGSIIDYKTGQRRAHAHARYEMQVLLYAAAYRALKGHLPPFAHLVYVDAEEIVPVEMSNERIDAALQFATEAVAAIREEKAAPVPA